MIAQFVFLGFEICGMRISSTNDLDIQYKTTSDYHNKHLQHTTNIYFKRVLIEVLLLFLALPESLQDDITEVRIVEETLPADGYHYLHTILITPRHLACSLGMSTHSWSEGFSPTISIAF